MLLDFTCVFPSGAASVMCVECCMCLSCCLDWKTDRLFLWVCGWRCRRPEIVPGFMLSLGRSGGPRLSLTSSYSLLLSSFSLSSLLLPISPVLRLRERECEEVVLRHLHSYFSLFLCPSPTDIDVQSAKCVCSAPPLLICTHSACSDIG